MSDKVTLACLLSLPKLFFVGNVMSSKCELPTAKSVGFLLQ
jgi:hypothetical protein